MCSKLESEPSLTLQKLTEDCQKIEFIKKDSKDIESGISHIKRVVKQTKTHQKKTQDRKTITHTRANLTTNSKKEKFLVLAIDAEAYIG